MRLLRFLVLIPLLTCCKPTPAVEPVSPGTSTSPGKGTPTEVGKPIGVLTTKTIGPAGGVITTADGKLTLTFPAGALTKESVITVQPVENKAINGIGIGYEFGPDGTRFAKPVTLTYHYTPDELLGASPQAMGLASQTADRSWVMERFVAVDQVARTITGKLDHFSWWSIITCFSMTPEQAVVGPATWIDLKITQAAELPTIPSTADADKVPLLTPVIPLAPKGVDPFLVRDISLNGNNKWADLLNPANTNGHLGYDHRAQEAVIRYYAPVQIPENNPIAVAVTLAIDSKAQFMLVSNLTVENENSFTIKGKRFEKVQVAASFTGGRFTLSMMDLDRPEDMNVLYAHAKLTGQGSADFNLDGTGASAGVGGKDRIEGKTVYRTCQDEFAEGGSITITKLFEKNGQRLVEGTVVGTVVEKHIVDQRTCAVIEHKTFQISARFQTPLL